MTYVHGVFAGMQCTAEHWSAACAHHAQCCHQRLTTDTHQTKTTAVWVYTKRGVYNANDAVECIKANESIWASRSASNVPPTDPIWAGTTTWAVLKDDWMCQLTLASSQNANDNMPADWNEYNKQCDWHWLHSCVPNHEEKKCRTVSNGLSAVAAELVEKPDTTHNQRQILRNVMFWDVS